ncbi:MAG: ROK family protein, partial [Verrucomicrobiota bacterium]
EVRGFFERMRSERGELASVGIGTFGPAGVVKGKSDYGFILETPKPGWSGVDFLGSVREAFGVGVPVVFETDVNAACFGEWRLGAGRGKESVAYVTVGTGIGGGLVQGGKIFRGRSHPEVGHMFVGEQGGVCPFHEGCWEGLASGTAMGARVGKRAEEIGVGDSAWREETRWLARGAVNLTAAWAPEVILFGGGVSQTNGLVEMIREEFLRESGNYWELPPVEEYLQVAGLGQEAGMVGCLELAAGLVG